MNLYRLKSILPLLIHYLSFDDLEKLSKILYVDDSYFSIILYRDFKKTLSHREEYLKFLSVSKPLNDIKKEFILSCRFHIDVTTINRIFELKRYYIKYVDFNGNFLNYSNHDGGLRKIDYIISDSNNCDNDGYYLGKDIINSDGLIRLINSRLLDSKVKSLPNLNYAKKKYHNHELFKGFNNEDFFNSFKNYDSNIMCKEMIALKWNNFYVFYEHGDCSKVDNVSISVYYTLLNLPYEWLTKILYKLL